MVSVASSVAWWARTAPQRTALVYQGQSLSFAQLQDRVQATAGLFNHHGIGAGDIVAVLMKNSAAFLEVSLALSHVGAVFLPVNYRLGVDEVAYIAGHAGVKLLVADEAFQAVVPRDVPVLICDAAAQADSRLLADRPMPVAVPHESRPDDLYRLMYTSGTTDRPKGVMHT